MCFRSDTGLGWGFVRADMGIELNDRSEAGKPLND